jgi:hypothetical protein
MTTARARGGWVAVLAAVALVVSCGAEKRRPAPSEDEPLHFGAENLPDADQKTSIFEALDDDERAAVEKSGMSGLEEPGEAIADEPTPRDEKTRDNKGAAVISILSVAVSAAAAAAPFLLF